MCSIRFFIILTDLEPKTTYQEPELVMLLQQRSDKAFGYLYDNYSGALYSVINQIVPDKEIANDVLQEVFVNIWRKISSYDPSKGRLFTWMLNIARNASIDKLRSRQYQDGLKNQPLSDSVSNNWNQSVVKPSMDDIGLKKVISKLKEEYRTLIDLSYFQGFTHEEISRALNIPLGTVKTRIRTALIQLRTMIQ
jgi:RNA polymerase sigma factor (sigma-70 family)